MVYRVAASPRPDDHGDQDRHLPHVARRAGPRAERPVPPGAGPGRRARDRPGARRPARAGSTPTGSVPTSVLVDQPELQQAVRWNLFQIAQAAARAEQSGVPAKGVTGSGYSGHYFWDTEIYVLPFLTYTSPAMARSAMRFRYKLLDAARTRAQELTQVGALYPWRTINGSEASAYYAAGTAQYHIDADVAFALCKYVAASGDHDFMNREGVDILVETARMWADLGFWRENGDGRRSFHIHGVTGPDEYTTVVNDNLFTNVMARFNLDQAAVDARLDEDGGAGRVRACRRAAADPRGRGGRVDRGRAGDDDPLRPGDRHQPAGLALPRPRGLGPGEHADGQAAAAAALPPAGDLPLPGAQAGRRRAGALPAGRPLHRRAEARRLRVLRPDHHRRLDAVGGRAVDRRRRGGLRRPGAALLRELALRRPRQPARQHQRRRARGLDRRGLERAGLRLRRACATTTA